MHSTEAGERRKTLQRSARELARDAKALRTAAKHLPTARRKAQMLQEEAEAALTKAESLKLQARLEDLTVWEMVKTKETKKGSKTYTYWMATWREGNKTRNVHLGSSRKLGVEAALQKARKMKAEAFGVQA